MIRRVLLVAAALAAAAATMTHWAVLLIAVALYVTTVILTALSRQSVRTGGDADQTGAAIVISVATGIVVLHADPDALSLWAVAAVLALLHGLHLVRHVLRVLVFRGWRGAADWRNVVVAAPVPDRVNPVAGPTLVAIPVWVLAPILAIFDADPFVYLLLGVACLALVIGTLVPISRALLHNIRMPAEPARLAALAAALHKIAPEILVHFNARAASAYAIIEWMTVLERLNEKHRVVILTVDRQPWHFDTIPPTTIPLVHLVGAEAIEYFVERVPTLTLALYPRNTSANKNLLRVPGLYDIYIGHGESDKAEAANPATRAFDEIWVAGDAAKSRYLTANIGVHEDQIRITGRPQLSELLSRGADAPTPTKSVVYAPTWEGYYADDGYSSIATLGDQVATALLSLDDVRVTYLPHPALGSLNREFANAGHHVDARIRSAGGQSVLEGTLADRYAVLAAADVLVTDVSDDLVDYLALDRPYVVLDAMAETPTAPLDAFVVANPSASAGTVLNAQTIGTLGAVVARALEEKADTGSRAQLAHRYLGDLSEAPIERFLGEVDRTLALVRNTRPSRALPHSDEATA